MITSRIFQSLDLFMFGSYAELSNGHIRPKLHTGSFYHGRYCPCYDLGVQPEGPVVYVIQVEPHPFLEADAVASVDLPDAGDAGFD